MGTAAGLKPEELSRLDKQRASPESAQYQDEVVERRERFRTVVKMERLGISRSQIEYKLCLEQAYIQRLGVRITLRMKLGMLLMLNQISYS